MRATLFTILCLLLAINTLSAKRVNRPINNVVIKDLRGKPAAIPQWGKQHIIIFYVDPNRPNQNKDFTLRLEHENLLRHIDAKCLGVLNLKDAPLLPNGLVRMLVRNRVEKNGELVLSDEDRILATKWGLGDCNNLFTFLVINRKGELVYVAKGELNEKEQQDFLDFVNQLD